MFKTNIRRTASGYALRELCANSNQHQQQVSHPIGDLEVVQGKRQPRNETEQESKSRKSNVRDIAEKSAQSKTKEKRTKNTMNNRTQFQASFTRW